MKYDKKNLVVKANKVIEARYKLTVLEQKLIAFVISLIRLDDEDFKIFEIRVKELADFLGIESKDIYSKMKSITRKMLTRELILKDEGRELQLTWLSSADYYEGKGIVEIEISEKMKPFLLQLRRHFTKYEIQNVIQFKSVYAFRIYELLKQYEDLGFRRFNIDDLREILGIKGNQYLKYSAFKTYVLLKAQSEIEKHTDISFNFKEIKDGRRITTIEFTISSIKQKKLNFPSFTSTDNTTERKEEELKLIETLTNAGFTEKQAIEIIIKIPFNQILRNIEYTKKKSQKGNIKNLTGYLFKAIMEDFASKESQSSPQFKEKIRLQKEKVLIMEKLSEFQDLNGIEKGIEGLTQEEKADFQAYMENEGLPIIEQQGGGYRLKKAG
jgi:plasmid replication initiation protein